MCYLKQRCLSILDIILLASTLTFIICSIFVVYDWLYYVFSLLTPYFSGIYSIIHNCWTFIWYKISQGIFTSRCIYNFSGVTLQEAINHCCALSANIPLEFMEKCYAVGINYNTCIDILQKMPNNFLHYFTINNLNFDPLEFLRLFPL